LTGGIGSIVGFALGEGAGGLGRLGAEVGGAASYVFGPAAVAKLLESPGVREWITRPPVGELKALQSLPNADKIAITDGLIQTITAAQKQGMTVSPALLGAIMGSRNYPLGPNTKRLKEKSAELRATP
jgi:hypothetical protein